MMIEDNDGLEDCTAAQSEPVHSGAFEPECPTVSGNASYEAEAAREHRKAEEVRYQSEQLNYQSEKLRAENIAQQREADRDRAKDERKNERKRMRNNILSFLFSLPRTALGFAVLAVVVAVLIGLVSLNAAKPNVVLTSSQLQKIVQVSKLSTAEFAYEGIAEQKDADGNTTCHVFYRAKIKAGADMSAIEFQVDDEAKKVYPVLPEIEIDDPEVDESSFDFFEWNPNISTKDLISICKRDALEEVRASGNIDEIAKQNLRDTIEALCSPLLEETGYAISWDDPDSAPASDESKVEGQSDKAEKKDDSSEDEPQDKAATKKKGE